jgi:cell wall-associated NlpC family hydrolase
MRVDKPNWERYQIIPFVDGGRDFNGADCWGIIYLVYLHELDIKLPSYGAIGATELRAVYEQIKTDKIGKDWRPITIGEEQIFDVVVMSATERRDGTLRLAEVHVGLVIEPGRIIHTEEDLGVMCMDFRTTHRGRANPLVSRRVKTIHRHIGVK